MTAPASTVKLASPTFSTGAQDDLVVQDVYKKTDGAVVNSIQDLGSQATVESVSTVRGGPQSASALSQAELTKKTTEPTLMERLSAAGSSFLANVKAAPGRIKKAMSSATPSSSNTFVSSVKSGFKATKSAVKTTAKAVNSVQSDIRYVRTVSNNTKSFVTTVKSGATAAKREISGTPGQVRGDIKLSTTGKNPQRIDTGQMARFNELNRLITNVNGASDSIMITDNDAKSGVLGGIFKESTDAGMKGTYSTVTAGETNPTVLRNVAAAGLPTAPQKGDVETVQQINTKAGPDTVLALNKQTLPTLAANYDESPKLSIADRKQSYDGIVTTFDTTDPSWDTKTRKTDAGDVAALDLTTLQAGSEDFSSTMRLGALNSTDSRRELYPMSDMFATTDVQSPLKQDFPYTVVNASSRTQSQTVDPRLLSSSNLGYA